MKEVYLVMCEFSPRWSLSSDTYVDRVFTESQLAMAYAYLMNEKQDNLRYKYYVEEMEVLDSIPEDM